MKKIRCVDFKVCCSGHGVVNHNGNVKVLNGHTTVNNHNIPKMRGYTSRKACQNKDTGESFLGYKEPDELNLLENPMYISPNCSRKEIFQKENEGLPPVLKHEDAHKLLFGIPGLIKGYMVVGEKNEKGRAPHSAGRSTALTVESITEQTGNGNFEQFATSGKKDSSSIYSKVTFGDTKYIGYMSLSIENLRFISLDTAIDKSAAAPRLVDNTFGDDLAKGIQSYIESINQKPDLKPTATFGKFFKTTGYKMETTVGIYLNDDAIDILVDNLIKLIDNLEIRRCSGWMTVDSVIVDYNDGKMMRIKKSETICNNTKPEDASYTEYFTKA